MLPSTARTPLAAQLAERIRARGPITLADYMEACLYDPAHGYYSKPVNRRFADYYTSPDVHPVFGRLLARQLAEMWDLLGRPPTFCVAEAGAATGRLASHVLDFAERELPEFYLAIQYVAVERSAGRRAAQQMTLERHIRAGRADSATELPKSIAAGCILSNELLDALPVHRVVVEYGELREIYVDFDGSRFCEKLGPPSHPSVVEYFAAQNISLREGQFAEAGLAAAGWIEAAGGRLERGFLLTVDYGHDARTLYDGHHMRGTLLAYQKHRASEDYYAAPGEQDLTAHVNFTALEIWGRRAGLESAGCVSQSQFLLALGRGTEFADLYDPGQDELARFRARLLLKNLIHPEGMGETFRVLVQHKGFDAHPSLTGLQPI